MSAAASWRALAAAAVLAAPPPCAAARAPSVQTVTIRQMQFAPVPKLHVGDTVEWVNDDLFVHSATATDKSFDLELKPKAHVRMRVTKPGRFPFFCRYHPGMKGTLVVEGRRGGG